MVYPNQWHSFVTGLIFWLSNQLLKVALDAMNSFKVTKQYNVLKQSGKNMAELAL